MLNGTIIKGIGGIYFVDTENGIYQCPARGLFRIQDKSPIVGDYVEILITDEDKKIGYLNIIFDRKNELIRPKIANIDQSIIIFAAKNPNINIDLLDRFIVLAEEQNLEILICINKIELVTESFYNDLKEKYESVGYKTFCVSAYEDVGVEDLREAMTSKVSIVAGPSGVGKSSILNKAFPGIELKTGEISQKIKRGKHSTRHSEFLKLTKGGYIADTPGFTLISLDKIERDNMQLYFKEFKPFLGKCKFNNCIHDLEPECEIKNHVGKEIREDRYKSYLSFIKKQTN